MTEWAKIEGEEEKKVEQANALSSEEFLMKMANNDENGTDNATSATAELTQNLPPTSDSHPVGTGVSTASNTGDAGALAGFATNAPTAALHQSLLGQTTTTTADANAALAACILNNPLLLQAAAAHLQQTQQQQLLQQQAAALVAATGHLTHNLIPTHLQASALAASLNGTPGYQPALIPPSLLPATQLALSQLNLNTLQPAPSPPLAFPAMTVQDRPTVTPVYNGVNPNYPGLRVLNSNPPVFAVDNFLTPLECQFLVAVASDSFGPAPVVGKGSGEVSPSRTSSTCYLAREDLPDYMRKVALLTGKPIEHCELPQVGRYLPSQQYLQHFDAFDTSNEDGRRFAANGGQRTVTVLVYLNDVLRGGATRFPALNLDVQPRQGMALVFFPATVDGLLDKMALHAALPAVDPKFVSQVWIRQSTYNGQPSKRLPQPMGAPLQPTVALQPAVAPPAQQQQLQQPVPAAPAVALPPQQLQPQQQQLQQPAPAIPSPVPLPSSSNVTSRIPNPLAPNNLPATF